MSTRTVFSALPIGTAFVFIGNPNPFTKDSDFVARGYQAYNKGGSFIVSTIHGEFRTDAIVDIIVKIDISKGN